ncbi:MAG: hypothetical protein RMJ57_03335 [Bacteroidia bacterium]|nr:hypothetical protein [Bacteroidia bacterium]
MGRNSISLWGLYTPQFPYQVEHLCRISEGVAGKIGEVRLIYPLQPAMHFFHRGLAMSLSRFPGVSLRSLGNKERLGVCRPIKGGLGGNSFMRYLSFWS